MWIVVNALPTAVLRLQSEEPCEADWPVHPRSQGSGVTMAPVGVFFFWLGMAGFLATATFLVWEDNRSVKII